MLISGLWCYVCDLVYIVRQDKICVEVYFTNCPNYLDSRVCLISKLVLQLIDFLNVRLNVRLPRFPRISSVMTRQLHWFLFYARLEYSSTSLFQAAIPFSSHWSNWVNNVVNVCQSFFLDFLPSIVQFFWRSDNNCSTNKRKYNAILLFVPLFYLFLSIRLQFVSSLTLFGAVRAPLFGLWHSGAI